MKDPEFRHIEWTPERVRTFWSYVARSPQAPQAYFSSHTGDELIRFVERHLTLLPDTRIVDWGCGPGFLVERLLQRNLSAEGLEFSPDSAAQTGSRCARFGRFGGVTIAEGLPSPLRDGSVDVVFLVEVLEHLLPGQTEATLSDIHRVLRPGGVLVASTPHAEDLRVNQTVCPDCRLVFHPWQHVASFTERSLATLAERLGFETRLCTAVNLRARATGRWARRIRRALGIPTAPPPHLIYVGARR